MEYYSAIKRNKIMPFAATWMQLETLILSEGSQREKDMISLISGKKSHSKTYMHPYVHRSTIDNSQDMETTQMSIYR